MQTWIQVSLQNTQVTVDGQTMSLDTAWDKLKGYKKVFHDGKEDFWQGIVDPVSLMMNTQNIWM